LLLDIAPHLPEYENRTRFCAENGDQVSRKSKWKFRFRSQLVLAIGGTMTTNQINWNQDQPAPRHAIRFIHANFPQVKNLGIYVCRNVEGTNVRSSHAEGRALDIGLRADIPAERLIGDQLFRAIIASATKSGIDNVIWNRQIWSVSHPHLRPFVGAYSSGAPRNPHTDHIHVEWTRDGSQLGRLQFLELQVSIVRQGIEEISAFNRDKA
jgi:hypothetical protein